MNIFSFFALKPTDRSQGRFVDDLGSLALRNVMVVVLAPGVETLML